MITAIRLVLTSVLVWFAALGHSWALFILLGSIVIVLELNSILVVRVYNATCKERDVQQIIKGLRGRR